MIILGIDPGTQILGYALLDTGDTQSLSHSATPQAPAILAMDVLYLKKIPDFNLRIRKIFESTVRIIDSFHPDHLAIEAPFFGKNVQSMLKLGRAQGVAIAAAIHHGVPIHEYAPMKIKMALTGNGSASKEQVAGMLQRLLKIPNEEMSKFMDATDALAAAYCHFMQAGKPESDVKYKGWKDFVNKNQEKVSKRKTKDEND